MNREQKTQLIASLKEKFDNSAVVIFTNFRGLSVPEMTELRSMFRKSNVEYKVVKNTLLKKALADKPYYKDIEPFLKDMTAIALSYDDPTSPAKVIYEFRKKNEKLTIKCGILDGKKITEKEISQLAKLPGKDELRAKLLATLNAPVTEFLRLLQAPLLNFLYLLQARQKKLEEKS